MWRLARLAAAAARAVGGLRRNKLEVISYLLRTTACAGLISDDAAQWYFDLALPCICVRNRDVDVYMGVFVAKRACRGREHQCRGYSRRRALRVSLTSLHVRLWAVVTAVGTAAVMGASAPPPATPTRL